jgi:hypothetical protein
MVEAKLSDEKNDPVRQPPTTYPLPLPLPEPVAELGWKLKVGRQIFFTTQHINCQLRIEIQDINKNVLFLSQRLCKPMVHYLHYDPLHHLRESNTKMIFSLLQFFKIVMQYLHLSSSYFNLENTIKLHRNLSKTITQHNAQNITNRIQN